MRVLVIEQDDRLGGNHTWSFHGADLSAAQRQWLAPLIEYSWDGYDVRFPGLQRTLAGTYHSITAEHLDSIARARLGDSVRTNLRIDSMTPDSVLLDDGSRLTAGAVIDGRGPRASDNLDVRFQKFVGRIVETRAEHGLQRPVIMDATQAQDDGYRFFYLLPFSSTTLLIEDTRYSDSPDVATADYGAEIEDYAGQQGWQIARTLREEEGVLPITLGGDIDAFWDERAKVACAGLQAALFHPATGYSLPCAMQLADTLAELGDWSANSVYRCTREVSTGLWRQTGFYRALNRMLFLAAEPLQRRQVLERFYGLNEGLISRFYAGRNTGTDKLRILVGKPPVPLGRAWQAVFGYAR